MKRKSSSLTLQNRLELSVKYRYLFAQYQQKFPFGFHLIEGNTKREKERGSFHFHILLILPSLHSLQFLFFLPSLKRNVGRKRPLHGNSLNRINFHGPLLSHLYSCNSDTQKGIQLQRKFSDDRFFRYDIIIDQI